MRFEARHAEPRHLVRAEDGPILKAFEKEKVILKEMKISQKTLKRKKKDLKAIFFKSFKSF